MGILMGAVTMEKIVFLVKPEEVSKEKKKIFPGEVFEAFNELIVENCNDGRAEFKEKDAVARMIEKGLNENDIYKKGWLNVEDVYRAVGWKVEYNKPLYLEGKFVYRETYDAFFEFKEKSR